MKEMQEGYLAYMLRLWQVCRDGRLVWLGSLESPHTGERRAFADLAQLFDFLQEQVQEHPEVRFSSAND